MSRLVVFILALSMVAASVSIATPQTSPVVPDKEWSTIDSPEAVGFSAKRLAALGTWLQSLDTTGMMIVVGGRSLFTYGDLSHLSYLASGRKSILSLLYGKYVASGAIDINKKLSDLEITDIGGLLPRERSATIRQLLTARSGVYHLASLGGDDLAHAPARGSVEPGSRFLYNNWDFNAAGTVFEKLTGRNIYDALETELAQPLGMQDFDRSRQVKNGDTKVSQHQAYPIFLSTRDMARVGLLALRGGRWGDRQIVPADWIRRTTTLVSPFSVMDQTFEDSPPTVGRWGYGSLWWVWDPTSPSDPLAGAFTAWGVGGQYITVIPKLDMVIAHKTDTANRKAVTARQYNAVLQMVLAAQL